jgi:hypothetical protein
MNQIPRAVPAHLPVRSCALVVLATALILIVGTAAEHGTGPLLATSTIGPFAFGGATGNTGTTETKETVYTTAGVPSTAQPNNRARLADEELKKPEAILAAEGLSLNGAIDRLARVVELRDRVDYVLLLLVVAQTYIIDVLERLAFLGIKGVVGSGKSRTSLVVEFLGKEVVIATSLSPKLLTRLAATKNGLAIDRLDRILSKTNQDAASISQLFDAGSERGIPYRCLEFDESTRRWVNAEYETFAVRFGNYVELPEAEVSSASRLVEIETVLSRKGGTRRNAARYWRDLAPVRLWLEDEARRALGKYDMHKVDKLQDSPEFTKFSDARDLDTETPRRASLAELLWIVATVFEWPVEAEIVKWAATKQPVEPRLEDQVRLALRAVLIREDRPGLVLADEIWRVAPAWKLKVPSAEVFSEVAKIDGGTASDERIWNVMAKRLGFPQSQKVSESDRRSAVVFTFPRLAAIGLTAVIDPSLTVPDDGSDGYGGVGTPGMRGTGTVPAEVKVPIPGGTPGVGMVGTENSRHPTHPAPELGGRDGVPTDGDSASTSHPSHHPPSLTDSPRVARRRAP